MKNILIAGLLLFLNECGCGGEIEYYHFCDISNDSNDTVYVAIEIFNSTDSIFNDVKRLLPHDTCEYKMEYRKNEALKLFDKYKFLFIKDFTRPLPKDCILATKYATVDSLEKWGWVVTYP